MTLHITPLDVLATVVAALVLSRDFVAKLVVNERVLLMNINWLGWVLVFALIGADVLILHSQQTERPLPYVWVSVELPRAPSFPSEM